jgi:hypothetical protein
MKKKSSLLEMVIKTPCSKCLVKACCIRECDMLYQWNIKYSSLIDLNDIIMMLSGIVIIIYLRILSIIKLLNKERANFYSDKIEKLVEENIK